MIQSEPQANFALLNVTAAVEGEEEDATLPPLKYFPNGK